MICNSHIKLRNYWLWIIADREKLSVAMDTTRSSMLWWMVDGLIPMHIWAVLTGSVGYIFKILDGRLER